MAQHFPDYHAARTHAAGKANDLGSPMAIKRAVGPLYPSGGFLVSLVSRCDADYHVAEVVHPGEDPRAGADHRLIRPSPRR